MILNIVKKLENSNSKNNMKKIYLLLLMMSLFSCRKEYESPQFSVEYLSGKCLNSNFPPDTTIIIGSPKEYNTIITDCDSAPKIDFGKYFLIGHYTSGRCSLKNQKELTADIPNGKYIYNITVIQEGTCSALAVDMNWAVVSRCIDFNYTIEVNIK